MNDNGIQRYVLINRLISCLSDGCVCPCSYQGIASVVSYVHTKQRHPRVIWVNLRDDVTIQCDRVTYSVRDTAALDEPVLLPAATRSDIEVIMIGLCALRNGTQRSVQQPQFRSYRNVPQCCSHWFNQSINQSFICS